MAVALEFIDFIVPISIIQAKYPGGWDECLHEHEPLMGPGGRVWHDEHLLRDGAMNPRDIEELIGWWQERGLEPYDFTGGSRRWKDVCVVEHMLGGPTLSCDWIEVDLDARAAFLKGTYQGAVIGRPEAPN